MEIFRYFAAGHKKTRIHHQQLKTGRGTTGTALQKYTKMEYSKEFFEKVFSTKRMERYFSLYPDKVDRAMLHYCCNLQLAEAFYISLSVLEVTLRNALCRELETMAGREDWYAIFPTTPGLVKLNRYVTQANNQIIGRHEDVNPSKVVAELTLGFWVSLLNSEYERLLWKDLRRAFPFMPKSERKRKNVSAPLNQFRILRNRVFHNEPICWNLSRVEKIHREMVMVMGWINRDVPGWLAQTDRFDAVCRQIRATMEWV